MTILTPEDLSRPGHALPFWLSLGTVPVVFLSVGLGGIFVFLMPVYSWVLFSILDLITGENEDNADLETLEEELYLYTLLTQIWFPIQFLTLCFMVWFVPQAGHLNLFEKFALFFGMGVMSGTIGINYSH
jgi:alkane 1-monooxygenase